MVRAFVARLFADPAVTRVQTDPSPDNGRAIRCYAKAGFHPVGEVDTPDGRALLMVCERPPVLTLRRAGAADVDTLHELMAAAAHHLAAQGFANWLPPYPRARIAADVVERAVYVVEAASGDAATPVATFMLGAAPHRPYDAMAWAGPDAPAQYLNRLAVHPAWQGRGVGAWCLAQMQRLAREAGATALRCDVLRANARLCRLYERHGFVARATRDHSGWTFTCYERVLD
jgi:ribosomal protein S18 acetylase RimI-like enzyme